MTELENKIEQLPDGRPLGYCNFNPFNPSLHANRPVHFGMTTDDLKSLLSELRRKTEALESAMDAVRKDVNLILHDSLSFGTVHPNGSMASYEKLFNDTLNAVERHIARAARKGDTK